MADQDLKWFVRDTEGEVSPPLTAAQVLHNIKEKIFTGSEMISESETSGWRPIVTNPEFYDAIIRELGEGQKQPEPEEASVAVAAPPKVEEAEPTRAPTAKELALRTPSEKRAEKAAPPQPRGPKQGKVAVEAVDAKDVPERSAERFDIRGGSGPGQGPGQLQEPIEANLTFEKSQIIRPKIINPPEGGSRTNGIETGNAPAGVPVADNLVGQAIGKAKSAKTKVKTRNRSAAGPLIFVALAAVIGIAGYITLKPKTVVGKEHLLAVRSGQPPLDIEKAREKYKKALQFFLRDTSSGYALAEGELVQIVEGNPALAPAWSLLCLVERERWPYIQQDAVDFAIVTKAEQMAKIAEPVGLNSATCEISRMMITNRVFEAANATDNWLQQQPNGAVLYLFKGELVSTKRDYNSAVSYFEQGVSLWPDWPKPQVELARALTQQGKFGDAANNYQQILSRHPKHPVAQIELGVLMANNMGGATEARTLILTGINSGERLPQKTLAAGYLVLAKIYLQEDKKDKALQAAQKAYSFNSSNGEARSLLIELGGMEVLKNTKIEKSELVSAGDQFENAGDCVTAQAEYKTAFDTDPTNGTAAMKAAKCLWQLHQSQEAITWANKAIKADPKLVPAFVMLADFYSQRFDYSLAMKTLETAVRVSPKSYEVFRGFARVELRRNNFAGAQKYAERALQLYESDSETYLILGEALLGQNKPVEAQKYAARAVEMNISDHAAQTLYAKILVGQQGTQAGLNHLDDLLLTDASASDYRIAKADILIADGRLADAEKVLRELLSLDAQNRKALSLLGQILTAGGRPKEALKVYIQAALLDPSDADSVFAAAVIYTDLKQYPDALSELQRVLKINSRYPRAHLALARVAMEQGDLKTAMAEAVSEKGVNPELSEAFIMTAEIYSAQGQFAACGSEYQKAVVKRKQSTEIYVRMARCYRRSGALDAALTLLKEAAARESGYANVHKELGAIYQTKGMADEALHEYDRYLALQPSAADRGQVQQQMRKIESGNLTIGPEDN